MCCPEVLLRISGEGGEHGPVPHMVAVDEGVEAAERRAAPAVQKDGPDAAAPERPGVVQVKAVVRSLYHRIGYRRIGDQQPEGHVGVYLPECGQVRLLRVAGSVRRRRLRLRRFLLRPWEGGTLFHLPVPTAGGRGRVHCRRRGAQARQRLRLGVLFGGAPVLQAQRGQCRQTDREGRRQHRLQQRNT